MSYRNGLSYLESKTKVLELCNKFGARVAVCPEWNGRVMTSTSDGLDGPSYGLIHVAELDALQTSRGLLGGEDQILLSPENGQFGLYRETEVDEHESRFSMSRNPRRLPKGFQEGQFTVDMAPPASPQIRMRRSVQITNAAGTMFDFDIARTVRLLGVETIYQIFGDSVAMSLEQTDVSYVGFETINTLYNHGSPLKRENGLVSIGIRGMFNSNQEMAMIVPFRSSEDTGLGPAVCSDFFEASPHGRLRMLPQAALLRADSKSRCQVGISRNRAVPFLGAIDFRAGLLTLMTFNMPPNPWELDYVSNAYCETTDNSVLDFVSTRKHPLREKDAPYSGEVVRAYNHGFTVPGRPPTAQFYEFDVFSPARTLNQRESLIHHQFTIHINADNQTLTYIVKAVLGVDYGCVYEKIIG